MHIKVTVAFLLIIILVTDQVFTRTCRGIRWRRCHGAKVCTIQEQY